MREDEGIEGSYQAIGLCASVLAIGSGLMIAVGLLLLVMAIASGDDVSAGVGVCLAMVVSGAWGLGIAEFFRLAVNVARDVTRIRQVLESRQASTVKR